MPISKASGSFICARCLRARKPTQFTKCRSLWSSRRLLSPITSEQDMKDNEVRSNSAKGTEKGDEEQGAMTRRLLEMTEQTLEKGGRAGAKAFKEAQFSEEL